MGNPHERLTTKPVRKGQIESIKLSIEEWRLCRKTGG